MTSQRDWKTLPAQGRTENQRLFFDEDERRLVEAAAARIIPTDHDPGALEAAVVEFIDRYLSGIGYIYASADGSGFLQIEGKEAEAWQRRVSALQERYRAGLRELEDLSRRKFERRFTDLGSQEQDDVLAELSGWPKPQRIDIKSTTEGETLPGVGGAPPSNQPIPDDELEFFPMLVLHARQGFYADPVYGGNRDHIGWQVVGFPGPRSLAETQAGTYTTVDYMLPDAVWPYADAGGHER